MMRYHQIALPLDCLFKDILRDVKTEHGGGHCHSRITDLQPRIVVAFLQRLGGKFLDDLGNVAYRHCLLRLQRL